jgi:hypothetical protein
LHKNLRKPAAKAVKPAPKSARKCAKSTAALTESAPKNARRPAKKQETRIAKKANAVRKLKLNFSKLSLKKPGKSPVFLFHRYLPNYPLQIFKESLQLK